MPDVCKRAWKRTQISKWLLLRKQNTTVLKFNLIENIVLNIFVFLGIYPCCFWVKVKHCGTSPKIWPNSKLWAAQQLYAKQWVMYRLYPADILCLDVCRQIIFA